jgi:predicted Zn-dependent protease
MKTLFVSLLISVLTGCATTTDQGEVGVNRKQLMLIPNSEIVKASVQGYEQLKAEAAAKGTLDTNPQQLATLAGILRRITPTTKMFRKDAVGWPWEVHAVTSQEMNAFCMPGGKIIFYSGIIEKLQLSDAETAAIMGHEIAHALREHGRERMTEELIKKLGLDLLVASGKLDPKYAEMANMITTIAVSLRHSRQQETEADDIGVELMARAGYDPRAAITLWEKMDRATGGKTPQFLSTHPSSKTRIENLRARMPKVLPLYENTLASLGNSTTN